MLKRYWLLVCLVVSACGVVPPVEGGGAGAGPGTCGSGATCGEGFACCGGACVGLESDPRNCGACGNVCAAGQLCNAGRCARLEPGPTCANGALCSPDLRCCGEVCIAQYADPSNCGTCGHICAPGQRCVEGACVR